MLVAAWMMTRLRDKPGKPKRPT